MQGYHDMRDEDDTPKWMVYAALVGVGVIATLLVLRIIDILI